MKVTIRKVCAFQAAKSRNYVLFGFYAMEEVKHQMKTTLKRDIEAICCKLCGLKCAYSELNFRKLD